MFSRSLAPSNPHVGKNPHEYPLVICYIAINMAL